MSLGCSCSIGQRWPSYGTVPGLRLTVVVENRAACGCTGAHGFAAWLEVGETIILLDTGPDPLLLAQNADHLGLDLGRVDAVVLSHGHNDHTGGLPAVVAAKAGRPLSIFMHSSATRRRFSRRTGTPRDISMPAASLAALNAQGVTFTPSIQPTQLFTGVWATGEIPRHHIIIPETNLVLDPDGRTSDPLDDDQALVIDTVHGTAIICGCAHAGVLNILDYIANLRPNVPLALLAGGLHLSTSDEPTLKALSLALRQHHPVRCAIGHCTGVHAEQILTAQLGGMITKLTCGIILEIL